jgi:hypothetical protein
MTYREIPVYRLIAERVYSYHNNPTNYQDGDIFTIIERQCLPHGSGFDSGCSIDLTKSKVDKIIIKFSWHHMDPNGFYAGWYDYVLTIKPSLVYDFDIKITGKEPPSSDGGFGLKEFFYDTFHNVLRDTAIYYWNNGNPTVELKYYKELREKKEQENVQA